ncbi:MAG: DUF5050 domain-containing protein [Lachnospiraceae bacterium]|nr:DUF5050 domain-containing protein [Lachnospiraceae bacterium]
MKSLVMKITISVLLVTLLGVGIFFHIRGSKTYYTSDYNVGNSGGNLYNGGFFCERDGVVYFANPNDGMSLYSTSRTGGDITKLSEDRVAYINADDHYIYYTRNNADKKTNFSFLNIQNYCLCRVDNNGKNREFLDSDPCLYACQIGDYIYYSHYDKKEASTLYRVKIDGKECEQVVNEPIIAVESDQNFLYYAGVKADHNLHRIDAKENSEITVNNGNYYNPIISEGYIYYMDGTNNYALAKQNLNSGEVTYVTTDRVDCFNLYGSTIYYQRSNEKNPALCRIKTDGTEYEEVYAGNNANINITSSYVYFSRFDDLSTFYCTPTTGKINVTTFNPGVIKN